VFIGLEVTSVESLCIMWFDFHVIVVAPVSLKERGCVKLYSNK